MLILVSTAGSVETSTSESVSSSVSVFSTTWERLNGLISLNCSAKPLPAGTSAANASVENFVIAAVMTRWYEENDAPDRAIITFWLKVFAQLELPLAKAILPTDRNLDMYFYRNHSKRTEIVLVAITLHLETS